MIGISNITKKFMGVECLKDISVRFDRGDRVAITGPNGAGKTTLVCIILGYYYPDNGKVLINGFDPIRDRIEVLKKASYIPQLSPPIKLTVKDLILYVSKSSAID